MTMVVTIALALLFDGCLIGGTDVAGELLDVSRLEQGRMQFDLHPYDISQIVDESIKGLQDQAKAKGLKLEQTKLTPMPQVFVDPERLRQAIDNIIGNGVKYTFRGGVSVSYQVQNGNLLTTIKDTGIGMDEKDQRNLFNKFYRIKNEKTADIPGTGLGLWISREIVRNMEGDILVSSTENVGSQFVISLPFMKEK